MIEIVNSLPCVVWKDTYNKWHIAQATTKDKLIDYVTIDNKALNYKLFNEGEYHRALKFKKDIEIRERKSVHM